MDQLSVCEGRGRWLAHMKPLSGPSSSKPYTSSVHLNAHAMRDLCMQRSPSRSKSFCARSPGIATTRDSGPLRVLDREPTDASALLRTTSPIER